MSNYTVSDNKSKLDINVIHSFLTNSYWVKGRSFEMVEKLISNSDCFGIYKGLQQIGFTRILTDYVTIAYLMDIFIIESFRGKGLSKLLLKTILDNPKYVEVKKWLLATMDTHALYKPFGFGPISSPERLMERTNQDND